MGMTSNNRPDTYHHLARSCGYPDHQNRTHAIQFAARPVGATTEPPSSNCMSFKVAPAGLHRAANIYRSPLADDPKQ
ncbi:hypothetical protein C8Q78DRAFT_1027472 [Trametes maxima]|nr:hypothetical protein C8Q78DRAFT_1027472 [Trametes maxima]